MSIIIHNYSPSTKLATSAREILVLIIFYTDNQKIIPDIKVRCVQIIESNLADKSDNNLEVVFHDRIVCLE